MATYAKGFKKQTSELILLKIIVGVIGAVLLIVLAVPAVLILPWVSRVFGRR